MVGVMTATTPQIPDFRLLLLQAADVTDSLVHQVGPDDLDRPTPCSEFAVRGLVDHLVMVAHRVRVVLQGGHFTEVPQVTGAPDDDLGPLWASRLAELRAALPEIDLASMVTAPFGTVPAGAALASYAAELTAHGWDLAAALDRPDLLDGSLGTRLLPMVVPRIPREGREQLPFGEVVDVPDDASDLDRLVAWMGRDPAWRA